MTDPPHAIPVLPVGRILYVSGPFDARIAAIAAVQRNQMSLAQLAAAGLSRQAIARRVNDGRLTRRHRRVFALAGYEEIPLADEAAALLALGARAALSEHSAATLLGMRRGRARPVHVVVPHAARPEPLEGVVIHRSRTLCTRDVQCREQLPVTSPARTLLDISARLPDRDVEQALKEALAQRQVTLEDVADVLRRAGGHPGAARLHRVSDAIAPGGLTDTAAERRLLRLITQAQLPAPLTQQYVEQYRADFLWPELKLIVEADGGVHDSSAKFEADRRRDTRLRTIGYTVLRFTNGRIASDPFAVIAELSAVLRSLEAQRPTGRTRAQAEPPAARSRSPSPPAAA